MSAELSGNFHGGRKLIGDRLPVNHYGAILGMQMPRIALLRQVRPRNPAH
jgi:hypothetical protein